MIEIVNSGEMDANSIFLMGASTKDESKIGHFGSGNKYSIACLLKREIPFSIYSGLHKFKFEVKDVDFRDSRFGVIYVDGEKTSFTTDMGKDWEDWFIIREFYSNAKDEGDYELNIVDEEQPESGKTKIYVEGLDDIAEKLDEYFLDEFQEEYETHYGKISISDKVENVLYRKGIRVGSCKKSLFSYNFNSIDITEARTITYEHEKLERIASFYTVCKNEDTIIKFLNVQEDSDYLEHNLYWSYVKDTFSKTWRKVLKGKKVFPVESKRFLTAGRCLDNYIFVQKSLYEKIKKEEICNVMGDSLLEQCFIIEDENLRDIVNNNINELVSLKLVKPFEFHIFTTEMDDLVAFERLGNVYFNKDFIDVNDIQETILEEYHHILGHHDEDRSYENFLRREIIRLSKGL